MATIKHECPHCRVKDMALVVSTWTPHSGTRYAGIAHLTCPRCSLPSAAKIEARQGGGEYNQLIQNGGDPTYNSPWAISNFWPRPSGPEVPDNLPEDVNRIYLQAESNFAINGNEEAAGTMYRKALDVGLKKIDTALTGTLGQKIQSLTKSGKLTSDILEWSTHVRDLGNDAAHEEIPPTREELENLRGFTDMVLQYLFTLPAMVKKRREQIPSAE